MCGKSGTPMKPVLFGASVCGAAHQRCGLPCQDNFEIRDHRYVSSAKGNRGRFYAGLPRDAILLAAADGHGSRTCPYSKTGSRIAVNVFCDIMAEFCTKYRKDWPAFERQLQKEPDMIRLAQSIEIDWKKRVCRDYTRNRNRRLTPFAGAEQPDEYSVYRLYGTTLLGALVTSRFIFSFRLGDGDINIVSPEGVTPLIEGERLLGVETHSLSQKGAWFNAETSFRPLRELKTPMALLLSTDGLLNSYVSDEEFSKSCVEYLRRIEDSGPDQVKALLPKWLAETSREGCGDDITAVFAYFK